MLRRTHRRLTIADRSWHRWLAAAALVSLGALAPLAGVASDPASQTVSPIEQLAWMTGCWRAEYPGRTTVEHWLPPSGGTMLGVSRTVRGGVTVEYEFLRIWERQGRLVYTPLPSGQSMVDFAEAQLGDGAVTWENPEHDFPNRIGYEVSGDSLRAWIEGGDGSDPTRIDFSKERYECPQ